MANQPRTTKRRARKLNEDPPVDETRSGPGTNRWVKVRGARVHNLQNIDVDFPQGKIVVCCGVSGSGKSSFAFDTVFAEGQRRYIESLSSYARQFLGAASKPDVDRIDGLSPAVSIDQKTTSHNPRSTVGTVTEIWDYLRVLYARAGTPHCPQCGKLLQESTPANLAREIATQYGNATIILLSPLVRGRKGTHAALLEEYLNKGYSRVVIDGEIYRIEDAPELDKNTKHTIDLVIDRITLTSSNDSRLRASLETALTQSLGLVGVTQASSDTAASTCTYYSTQAACLDCELSCPPLEPRLFSFNSPYGACPTCAGLGSRREVEHSLLVNPDLAISQGALLPWFTSSGWPHFSSLCQQVLAATNEDLDTPWKDLTAEARDLLITGKPRMTVKAVFDAIGPARSYTTTFEGLASWVKRRGGDNPEQGDSRLEKYFTNAPCPACGGTRLAPIPAAVQFSGQTLGELAHWSLVNLHDWVSNLQLTGTHETIAGPLIKEISSRLEFLVHVGLGYLSLDRTAATLSGGEAQRIRLASQIGSGLTGVLYVLDEPSIGLHPKDNSALLGMLTRLRDLGNTVLVVEHDEDTLKLADWIIEIGPAAGNKGGQVVHNGTTQTWRQAKDSPTYPFLSGQKQIDTPQERRQSKGTLTLHKPSGNNLNIDKVDFPLGCLIAVTGVSGSGKSTLVSDTLAPELGRILNKSISATAPHAGITGAEQLDKIVIVDQAPIGRTPRSNPATYTGVFDRIRGLYAELPQSKLNGYKPGRFSFNVRGGRCEACAGEGQLRVEMSFLPDVYVECEECEGTRYNAPTLAVTYKGKSIADVLKLTIDEAAEFFSAVPAVSRQLKVLQDVGLGYVPVGHPATMLSGGEAQRVKLATELQRRATGKTFYVLDEPTTGLHFADVAKLLDVCQRLVDQGNTMVIIEHNLDVIRTADHVVDLGPDGGSGGGRLVATGTPEEVSRSEGHTARYLARELDRHARS